MVLYIFCNYIGVVDGEWRNTLSEREVPAIKKTKTGTILNTVI